MWICVCEPAEVNATGFFKLIEFREGRRIELRAAGNLPGSNVDNECYSTFLEELSTFLLKRSLVHQIDKFHGGNYDRVGKEIVWQKF